MAEFFEFLDDLETPVPVTRSGDYPQFDTTVGDRAFKTVIMLCILVSIVIQLVVATRFYEGFDRLGDCLPPYPVTRPLEVDLEFAIPELLEFDRNMDRMTQRLDQRLEARRALSKAEGESQPEMLSTRAQRKTKPRKTYQVVVVEEVNN
jgi:hypothetical protein